MSVRRLRVVVWTCTVHVPVCSTFVLIYFVLRSVIYSSYPQSWRNSSAIAALALCCRLRYAASHNAISSQLVTVIVWLNYFHNLAIWDSSCGNVPGSLTAASCFERRTLCSFSRVALIVHVFRDPPAPGARVDQFQNPSLCSLWVR
eukprot:30535-Pelagococcus_subviridis.AAC.2